MIIKRERILTRKLRCNSEITSACGVAQSFMATKFQANGQQERKQTTKLNNNDQKN